MDFVKVEVPNFTYEKFYPFGNYQSEYYDKFSLFVKSPSQYYYSDLFGSFVLTPAEAWKLYKLIFDEQQCQNCQKSESDILDAIPDHMDTLESQFQAYYAIAYYNVVNYFNKL